MKRSTESRAGKTRRLIAGLRISQQDEALLDVVRSFFPEAETEGELAYRLWRRGLDVTLAEAVGIGAPLPPGTSEDSIARLAFQRLLLCLPLFRQTNLLALLGLELASSVSPPASELRSARVDAPEEPVDEHAAAAIVSLGGSEFL
jgi:hypothetical protein